MLLKSYRCYTKNYIMLYGNKKYSFDKNQLINFIDSFVECDNYNEYIEEEEEVNTEELSKELIL